MSLAPCLTRFLYRIPRFSVPSIRALAAATTFDRRFGPNSSSLFLYASSAATAVAFSSISRPALAEFSAEKVGMKSKPDIVLYQYEVCPFCNKVRAYLDYHGIPYRIIEVDPLRKTELEPFDKSYRKVPIAVVNGRQVNGSAAVIEHVRELTGSDDQPDALEQHWLEWLDDTFVHLIAPNIYRSWGESLQTFEYIADNAKFSTWQRGTIRYTGAMAMYMIGKRLKKKYDIQDERDAIHEAIRKWTEAIKKKGKFLGGDEPGVADLSVYGVLKAISGFDTFAELREKNEDLGEWFDRTRERVGEEAVTVRA